MQATLASDPNATGGMGGMEEATDTIGVPALVDGRTLMQFCQAIQQYADATGFHDEAQEKILELRAKLVKLGALAQMCRFAVLGLPKMCERVRDELECVAVDFPTDPLLCDAMECGCSHELTADEYRGPAQFAAAFDLLAGAAFVSKGDNKQRDRFIVGVVRAIEDAICFPVAYATEVAEYLDGTSAKFASAPVEAVIATATSRFLEGDFACDPRLPTQVRARLEQLACKWMRTNPVTELFCALTGPKWSGKLQSIQPSAANIGDEVTLRLCVSCADPVGDENSLVSRAGPNGLKVLFCPRQPAKIVRFSGNQVIVTVPAGSRSGPIALVRDFGSIWLDDIIYLLDRYACEYPVEWSYSVFTLIPMWQWAYPAAFGGPHIKVAVVPQKATVSAFSTYGLLGATDTVQVGDIVAIYYQVDPPGSDQHVPVQVSASSGSLSNLGIPGAIGFTPSNPGDASIKLSWGSLTSEVVVHVARGIL
jgi:hypothetical protein